MHRAVFATHHLLEPTIRDDLHEMPCDAEGSGRELVISQFPWWRSHQLNRCLRGCVLPPTPRLGLPPMRSVMAYWVRRVAGQLVLLVSGLTIGTTGPVGCRAGGRHPFARPLVGSPVRLLRAKL